jgi:SPP1 gp7 family putative phage head morphogenesis protein
MAVADNVRFANRPFLAAIRDMRERLVVVPTEYYGQRYGFARQQAFSVAGIARIDQLTQIRDSLVQAMERGDSMRDWIKRVERGEVPLELPRHRLDNIFRTNFQSAYGRGRCLHQRKYQKYFPFLTYSAVNDARTRPTHRALSGWTAPINHPAWSRIMPPNGYRCRCTTIALTEDQARARGIAIARTSSEWPHPQPEDQARARGIATGEPPAEPDDGWDYSPCGDQPLEGVVRAVEERAPVVPQPWAPAVKRLKQNLIDDAWLIRDVEQALNPFYPQYKAILEKNFSFNGTFLAGTGVLIVEGAAITHYTGEAYRWINDGLRHASGVDMESELTETDQVCYDSVLPAIAAMDRALEKLPRHKGVVHRGLDEDSVPHGYLESHEPGEIVRYAGYTSTSYGGVWEDFAGDIELIIQQENGVNITKLAKGGDYEREVLLPRNATFIVKKKYVREDEWGDVTVIEMEEIPPEEAQGKKIHQFSEM